MRKDLTQTGLQSILIRKKKQWSGVAIWQRGKDQNLFLMEQMVRFKIPTAMEMTHVLPRTPGIKHRFSWRQQAVSKACYFYSRQALSGILCKWKQDSAASLFLYLDSVLKLVHNQTLVMNRLYSFLLNFRHYSFQSILLILLLNCFIYASYKPFSLIDFCM